LIGQTKRKEPIRMEVLSRKLKYYQGVWLPNANWKNFYEKAGESKPRENTNNIVTKLKLTHIIAYALNNIEKSVQNIITNGLCVRCVLPKKVSSLISK
jgi:hypothetical protein